MLAAVCLGIPSPECLVVEDANAGVAAALAGNMKVLGMGDASGNDRATMPVKDLQEVTVESMLSL